MPYLYWQKLKVNIFPHDGEMEKVEGDGVRGGLSPLTLASKPHLLPQQRKVGLMRRQTQHHLPREHNTVANAASYTLHPAILTLELYTYIAYVAVPGKN